MEGSRINEDRTAVEEDTKLELELLEQEYSQYEETVQAEGAKSLEEAMANTAEAASNETAALGEEWAAFEERMYHVSRRMRLALPSLSVRVLNNPGNRIINCLTFCAADLLTSRKRPSWTQSCEKAKRSCAMR